MTPRLRLATLAASAVLVSLAARQASVPSRPAELPSSEQAAGGRPALHESPVADPAEVDPAGECSVRPLKLPSGRPAMVSCAEARRIVAQVRGRLALAPRTPELHAFAESTVGWLDPHGLWSAAPDAPPGPVVHAVAASLASELELSPRDATPCSAALEIGRAARGWVRALREELEASRASASERQVGVRRAFELATQPVYEDDPVTRPARVLARDLGARAGAFAKAFDDEAVQSSVALAIDRLLPSFDAEGWSRVALAAAVRAYVAGVDPHGQWVPLDEEWSLYAADAAVELGPRLWEHMARSAVGIRVLDGPAEPLRVGDLVLSVGGIVTAGLSVEQAEQLARLEPVGGESIRPVVVLRRGAARPTVVEVAMPELDDAEAPVVALASERVSYADGSVLVVRIQDVPDGLGEDLSATIASAQRGDRLLGVLLDLRGNGGGSTDGAASAIGVFLPGRPSFPILRRGGSVEVQRAFAPPPSGQWVGPVGALVDGYTASAAEMIAGALAAYDRGPVVGSRTFGKGCIQEYFDDRAGAGVLRLTTMLFALPDGSPLQGVGIVPTVRLSLTAPPEREATLTASLPPWRGPDVRLAAVDRAPAWPAHRGRLGACQERAVCTALGRLGSAAPETPRAAAAKGVIPRRIGARLPR